MYLCKHVRHQKNEVNKHLEKKSHKMTAVEKKYEGEGNSLFLQFISPLIKIISKFLMTWTIQCLR